MYPEEFPINFPLPIELHRGIRFNLAASLLKDKLKFPVNLQDYPSIFVLRLQKKVTYRGSSYMSLKTKHMDLLLVVDL